MVGDVAGLVQRVLGDDTTPARGSLKAPRTSFNGRVSPHRRFAFGQMSLDEVKKGVEAVMEQFPLPPGVGWQYGRSVEDSDDTAKINRAKDVLLGE